MDYKKRLEEKVQEHNVLLQEIDRLQGQRHAILGQIELLQELVDSEGETVNGRPKRKVPGGSQG